jgi:hypothetical protein
MRRKGISNYQQNETDFFSKIHSEEIVIGYVLHNDIYLVVYFIEKDNASENELGYRKAGM